MFSQVLRPEPGSQRVEVTRGAWTTLPRNFRDGDYLLTAETTGVYWTVAEQIPVVGVAVAGHFLPRDDSIVLRLSADRPLHYFLPAGGSLRIIEVEVLPHVDSE